MIIPFTRQWPLALSITVLFGGLTGCGEKNGQTPRTSEAGTMTEPRAAEARPPARRAARPQPPKKHGPYPEKWILAARLKHRMTCRRLVYKKGCSVLRRGVITVEVTLDSTGKVQTVKGLKNTIRVDPKLVLDCVKKELPTWRFHPPEGVQPRLVMKIRLIDKC